MRASQNQANYHAKKHAKNHVKKHVINKQLIMQKQAVRAGLGVADGNTAKLSGRRPAPRSW